MSEIIPLHSLPMEMSVLGSMMLGQDAPEIIRSIIPSPEMFYRPAHKVMYRACLDLMDDGLPPDLEFVIERLGSDLADIGNDDYVIQVAEYVPSPASAEYYAKVVLDLWAKRTLQGLADQITPDSSLEEILLRIDAVRNGSTKGVSMPIIGKIGEFDFDAELGVSTPWDAVNQLTSCHGFPQKQFAIVRAKTGVGKTPFLTQSAMEAAKAGRKVVYATFDDLDRSGLQARMMKYLTGWSRQPDKSPNLAADWHDAKVYLKSLGILVYDATESSKAKEIETFVSWLEYNQDKHQITDVYADYLQAMRTRARMDRLERQEEIATQFKECMASLGIAGVMGSQVSNNAQEGDMSKGGRDADDKAAIIFDIKPNDDRKTGELRISKNRYGPIVSLGYEFDNSTLGFRVVA